MISRRMFYQNEPSFVQPFLSANGTLGGENFAVGASSEYSSTYAAYKAFNSEYTSRWRPAPPFPSGNQYLIFYNPEKIKVRRIIITFYSIESGASSGIFYGSNDGTTWNQITSWSGNSSKTLTLNISNPAEYKYYKIFFNGLIVTGDYACYAVTHVAISATYAV